MNPAKSPTPVDRDRALALRRRLTTAVGIGGVSVVGAFVSLAAAGATGPTTASSTNAATTPWTAAPATTAQPAAGQATAAPTAAPTLTPPSTAVSSGSSGSVHAVSGGSGR
jgi:hypothetical protein